MNYAKQMCARSLHRHRSTRGCREGERVTVEQFCIQVCCSARCISLQGCSNTELRTFAPHSITRMQQKQSSRTPQVGDAPARCVGGLAWPNLLKVWLELGELVEQSLADATLLRRLDLAPVLDLSWFGCGRQEGEDTLIPSSLGGNHQRVCKDGVPTSSAPNFLNIFTAPLHRNLSWRRRRVADLPKVKRSSLFTDSRGKLVNGPAQPTGQLSFDISAAALKQAFTG